MKYLRRFESATPTNLDKDVVDILQDLFDEFNISKDDCKIKRASYFKKSEDGRRRVGFCHDIYIDTQGLDSKSEVIKSLNDSVLPRIRTLGYKCGLVKKFDIHTYNYIVVRVYSI